MTWHITTGNLKDTMIIRIAFLEMQLTDVWQGSKKSVIVMTRLRLCRVQPQLDLTGIPQTRVPFAVRRIQQGVKPRAPTAIAVVGGVDADVARGLPLMAKHEGALRAVATSQVSARQSVSSFSKRKGARMTNAPLFTTKCQRMKQTK